jgi:hypothetical protein
MVYFYQKVLSFYSNFGVENRGLLVKIGLCNQAFFLGKTKQF